MYTGFKIDSTIRVWRYYVMHYEMRRKDREMSRDEALAALDKAPFGTLATVDSDGVPYCIPLSMAREGEWLYFHCAMAGHKIDNLRADSRVCVSFVGKAEFPEDNFTVVFESAVVTGTAEEVTGDNEKIRGLRLISERFTPKNMNAFDAEIARLLTVTGVWKIRIEEIAGKIRKQP
jgi:nitroimidazol reductase NimA-like FMN-containing flavoprotein (pyridoxamine 5'-phosphate oxidase superfamily)